MLKVVGNNAHRNKIYLQYNQYDMPISYTTTDCKTKIQRSANVQMEYIIKNLTFIQ